MERDGCPPWCAEHVAGPGGVEHRATVGDVRLTLTGDSGGRRAICAVRRRAARTPAEMARLVSDLTAAGVLLRREARRFVQGDQRPRVAPGHLASV